MNADVNTPETLSRDLYDVIARRRDVRAEFSGETVDLGALRRVLDDPGTARG